jgi:hypothetical protein
MSRAARGTALHAEGTQMKKNALVLYQTIGLTSVLIVVGALTAASVFATSPQLPVQVVRASRAGALSAAALHYEVSANPSAVRDVQVESAVQSNGTIVLKRSLRSSQFAVPTAAMTAQEVVPEPQFAITQLDPGVYAHVIDVNVRLRGESDATKPLAIREIEYFRVANGNVSFITSEEYTATVQPSDEVVQADGSVQRVFRGAVVDMGISRSNVLGTTPVAASADAPRAPLMPRSGRRQ